MTNEDVERAIQQLLAGQRELQESQIRTSGQIQDLRGQMQDLTGQVQDLTGQVQDLTGQVQALTNLGAILLNSSAETNQRLNTLIELVTNHENRIQRLERPGQN